MRIIRRSTGQLIDLGVALGGGGEARIYAVPHDPTIVAKVYHRPSKERELKIALMLANPPDDPMASKGHVSIAWPMDLLLPADSSQRKVGFLMRYVVKLFRTGEPPQPAVGFLMRKIGEMKPIIDVYHPRTRRLHCPRFNYRYLHQTARNLAAAARAIHADGYVIGDVNESNILVSDSALVTLVDTDSFQVRDPAGGQIYPCPVGKLEFTAPEIQKELQRGKKFPDIPRRVEHDLFGLAVLIFQLLMEGTHPFNGRFLGRGEPRPLEEQIAAGHFPHGARGRALYSPPPHAPPLDILNPEVRRLFLRCFEDGHVDPTARPDAQEWLHALEEAEKTLVTCRVNLQHLHGNHLRDCPWCKRAAQLGGHDPFPSGKPAQRGAPSIPLPRPQQSTSVPPRPTSVPVAQRPSVPASKPRPVAQPAAPAPLATVSVARTSAGARSVQDRVEDRAEPHIGYTETYGGLNLEMVWIPRGTFPMGSRSAQAYSDEMPVHAVILDGFWLGKCEVTQRQYGALMGMNSSKFKGPNQPVENVSWNDAVEFCRKLSQATGKRYTLPTEAQWEYACRAGSTGEWCFGNDERALAGYAWYDMNSDGRTQDVGTKRANGWGLYDMHGNVWEWCADWYGPYTGGAQRNPAGPNTGTARVMRGGTWCHRPNHTRSALRSRNAPHRGHYGSGFRVCRVASP